MSTNGTASLATTMDSLRSIASELAKTHRTDAAYLRGHADELFGFAMYSDPAVRARQLADETEANAGSNPVVVAAFTSAATVLRALAPRK